MKKVVPILLTVGGLIACAWMIIPRSDHDLTHVDGRILQAGAPVAGAIVSISFPAPSHGGGDREMTDARGCVHLMARHSRQDRLVHMRVEYPGAAVETSTIATEASKRAPAAGTGGA